MPVRVRPPAPKYPSIYLSSLDRLADIYQIAKNCRTSVEMIEKYYAVHIKNTLDTSAINAAGRFFVSTTRIRGALSLRICPIGFRTTTADMDVLIDDVAALMTSA